MRFARGTRDPETSRAREVSSNRCFAHDNGRVYCAVAFERYLGDPDRYCLTGYTASYAGADVAGPLDGFQCGKLSQDGEPLPSR
jgi:hypothetical protein